MNNDVLSNEELKGALKGLNTFTVPVGNFPLNEDFMMAFFAEEGYISDDPSTYYKIGVELKGQNILTTNRITRIANLLMLNDGAEIKGGVIIYQGEKITDNRKAITSGAVLKFHQLVTLYPDVDWTEVSFRVVAKIDSINPYSANGEVLCSNISYTGFSDYQIGLQDLPVEWSDADRKAYKALRVKLLSSKLKPDVDINTAKVLTAVLKYQLPAATQPKKRRASTKK